MTRIQDLRLRAAGHEQVSGLLINRETVRTVLPTRGLPLRESLMCLKINRGREVFILVVHVEAAALCVDRIAFRPAFECQFFFLDQGLAVKNTDGVVAWRGDPNFFCGRYIDHAVGRGIDVATALARERLFINSAYTGVGPVTDIHTPSRRQSIRRSVPERV